MNDLRPLLHSLTRLGPSGEPSALGVPRVIWDRIGGSPYLSRWYPAGHRVEQDDETLKETPRFEDQVAHDSVVKVFGARDWNVFLHRFHRSDDDGALHSHPWKWSFSFILVGGYMEERRVRHGLKWIVERRAVLPFTFNFLSGNDYHRVDLLQEDAWTIFVAGPKIETWYFWDRTTGLRSQWERFIAWRRGEATDPGWEKTPDHTFYDLSRSFAGQIRMLDAAMQRARRSMRGGL